MNTAHTEVLKKRGLSVTPVRLAVLASIEHTPHSSADVIFNNVTKRIYAVSKQAIYHNLSVLVENNILRKIKPRGQPSLYEFYLGDNHNHLVCRSCNSIIDTQYLANAEPPTDYSRNQGFVIDEVEITLWGLCPPCQQTHPQQKYPLSPSSLRPHKS